MDQVASHGWDAYRVVFVTVAVALAVPVLLHFLTRLAGLGPRGDGAAAEAPPSERDIPVLQSINTRYFTAVQLAGLLALPFVLLVPFAALGGSPATTLLVLSVTLVGATALVYANRKGDLRWHDRVYREADETHSEGGAGGGP